MLKTHVLRIGVVPEKFISTGKMGKSNDGTRDIPRALNYFDCSDFPEIEQAYGPEPTQLMVMMPSNVVEECFNDRMAVYAGKKTDKPGDGVLIRSCDEEFAVHRLNETIGDKTFVQGEVTECTCAALEIPDKITKQTSSGPKEVLNPLRCRYHAWLKAYVALPPTYNVDNPNCVMFKTGSKNSGISVLSELQKIHAINQGVLAGIPFWLSVKMVPGKDNPKTKFPIWNLQMVGLLSQVRAERALKEGVDAPTLQLVQNTLSQRILDELEAISESPSETDLEVWLRRWKNTMTTLGEADQAKIRELYTVARGKIGAQR